MDIQAILEMTCSILQDNSDICTDITIDDNDVLVCKAHNCHPQAAFCATYIPDSWWISFVTPDRWLSESIEADLLNTGDDLEELLEEELVELGYNQPVSCEHFRSENMLYTFRSPLTNHINPADYQEIAHALAQYLMAYMACFRELGDVANSSGQ